MRRHAQPETDHERGHLLATSSEDLDGGLGLLLRLWGVVALFALVTGVRSAAVDIPLRDPAGNLFWPRLSSLALLVVVLAVAAAVIRLARRGHSWWPHRVVSELRRHWWPKRLGLVAGALVGYQVVYLCYRNLKSWDVLNEPRDGMLLDWDRWLFVGRDPALLLHDLLGRDAAAHVLHAVYVTFTPVVTLSLAAAVALLPRIRDVFAVVMSLALVWILGTGCYYLIPSLGPFATRPEWFADLPRLGFANGQSRLLLQRERVLTDPEAANSFASISAFASLHTGVLCVVVLLAFHFGLRWLGALLTIFLLLTMVATIYLGWHYVVDDIAGVAIAVLAVALGTRLAGSRAP